MNLLVIVRGGEYVRVADPDWADPLDPAFAERDGGRWNPPASFPTLYLNADLRTARARVDWQFEGLPYGPLDLRPDRRPVLVAVDVPTDTYADIVTDAGCAAAGLPTTYPFHPNGTEVGHDYCQPIGQAAHHADLPGVACRSAVLPGGEELAWFPAAVHSPKRTSTFDHWY